MRAFQAGSCRYCRWLLFFFSILLSTTFLLTFVCAHVRVCTVRFTRDRSKDSSLLFNRRRQRQNFIPFVLIRSPEKSLFPLNFSLWMFTTLLSLTHTLTFV